MFIHLRLLFLSKYVYPLRLGLPMQNLRASGVLSSYNVCVQTERDDMVTCRGMHMTNITGTRSDD
jgi:hypothetical protein